MAQNMFRRAMAYLGLVDEEYDDLDRAQSDARPFRAKPEPAPVASSRYDDADEYEPPVTKVTPMQPRRGDLGHRLGHPAPQVRPMGSGAAPGLGARRARPTPTSRSSSPRRSTRARRSPTPSRPTGPSS